jgi:signal peptidase I
VRTGDGSRDSFLDGFRRAGEWMLLAVVLGAAMAAVVVPRLGGATSYAVLTGSMRPAMPPGTLVVVRPVDPADIDVGSVITFQPREDDPTVVTHRVIGQGFDASGDLAFQTRGDANDAPDAGMVRPYQIVGERWYFVPYLGYVTDSLTGHQRQLGIYLAVGALLLYALVMFAGATRDRMRRPAEQAHA